MAGDYKDIQKAKQEQAAKKAYKEILTARVLRDTDMGEINWIVPGLLSEGATILAANPKAGKSWMALDLAMAVSQGEDFLGEFKTNRGSVLYLAMEDGARRVKDRLNVLDPEDRELRGVEMWFEWPPILEGGIAGMEMWIKNREQPRLIIVDTLRKIRSVRKVNEGVYEHDYDVIDPMNKLAHQYGIGVLIVHHTSKTRQEDPFMTVSGSLGLLGASDAVMVLIVNQETSGASLHVQGRDIESKTYDLVFSQVDCRWRLSGELDELAGMKKQILDILAESEEGLGTKQVAEKMEISSKTARRRLGEMESEGLLEAMGHTSNRVYKIKWKEDEREGASQRAEDNHK